MRTSGAGCAALESSPCQGGGAVMIAASTTTGTNSAATAVVWNSRAMDRLKGLSGGPSTDGAVKAAEFVRPLHHEVPATGLV